MKKGTVIALIVAGALILTGVFLAVMGLSLAKGSIKESTLTEHTVPVRENFENILIDTEDCNVEFLPYNGEADAHIVIRQQENASHNIFVADGTLKIEMQDDRNWTDYVRIYNVFGVTESMEMKIYLPKKQYESLRVYTDTGDIKVPGAFSVKEAVLQSDTGEVYCNGGISDLLSIITDAGDIQVHGCAPEMMQLESDTGDIKLSNVGAAEIHLRNDTGETELEKVNAQSITCESSTGEVDLNEVLAEVYLQIFTSTGDVEIENSDAGTVNIETDTGDVHGRFATSKWFQVHSDTGNVDVPLSREGGECRIETNTGNIHFE